MPTPTFASRAQLVRFIDPEHYQDNGRANVAAFIDDDSLSNAKYDGLSVNSMELHTRNQIAAIYEDKKKAARPIAVSVHLVSDYNSAFAGAGIAIEEVVHGEPPQAVWTFAAHGAQRPAYEHDPRDGNKSHCLVKVTCGFRTPLQWLQFARRLAYKPTYELVY